MSLSTQAALAADSGFQARVAAAISNSARNVDTEATTLAVEVASGAAPTSITVSPNLASTLAAGTEINIGGTDDFAVGTGGAASGQAVIPIATGTTFAHAHLRGESISPPTVANHALRGLLAVNILQALDTWKVRFAAAIAAIEEQNSPGATNATVTDANINTDVGTVWNLLAGIF